MLPLKKKIEMMTTNSAASQEEREERRKICMEPKMKPDKLQNEGEIREQE